MSADRLLSTLLRVLQDPPGVQDTARILGTIQALLVDLNNPRNVQLLVSHILSARTLWTRPDGLRFCLSLIGVFHSATRRVIQRHIDRASQEGLNYGTAPHIKPAQWINAVIAGAQEGQPRPARVTLALCGVLVAEHIFHDSESSSTASQDRLQSQIVHAANRTLNDTTSTELDHQAITLTLNHAFPLLHDYYKAELDYHKLLPIIVDAVYFSAEGYQSGYFLQAIDGDVRQISATQFRWAQDSPTFHNLQAIKTAPLIQSIGPLARLLAHAIENVRDSATVESVIQHLSNFTSKMHQQWRQNKISEIDAAEESIYLDGETLQVTLPSLWQLLQGILFATVLALRGVTGRLLADNALGRDNVVSAIAIDCLNCLRNLNFIFSRMSSAALSQYTFVHLTCLDILNNYPIDAATFLRAIASFDQGNIPAHPLDRISDLFYLNTAEHLTFALTEADTDALLVKAAQPYLHAAPTLALTPIFEAAHSVMLAVFASPRNANLTALHLPPYTDVLFESFPAKLSARQFRLAYKNLIRNASPPTELALKQSALAGILLDILLNKIQNASSPPIVSPTGGTGDESPMSEQAVLLAALIDALPFLDPLLLREWLDLLPHAFQSIGDPGMRQWCITHLWETFTNGSLDPRRAQMCVTWWTTEGGMQAITHSHSPMASEEYTMSGALPQRGEDEAKL